MKHLPETKQHNVKLHLLTPIHIGAGDELDPFSYVIRENRLILVDPLRWIEGDPDADKIVEMLSSDNFATSRSYIAENIDLSKAAICDIAIDSPDLIRTYRAAIAQSNPKNQVLATPLPRNHVTGNAFLPGSSIKGALRTALANQFVESAGVTSRDVSGRDGYDKKIFGKILEDPMRNVKISDVDLGPANTLFVKAQEIAMDPDKTPTPKDFKEVAGSLCHLGKAVSYPLRFGFSSFWMHNQSVDIEYIIEALNEFYLPKFLEEYEKFYKERRGALGIGPLNKAIIEMKANEALIRIGHFSHVECVTLDGIRKPKTRMKNGRPLPWGRTRTLANGIYPFGWAKIEFRDLPAEDRPPRQWPFTADPVQEGSRFFTGALASSGGFEGKTSDGVESEPHPTKQPVVPPPPEPLLTKLLKSLELINIDDMGRIGTVIQQFEELETDDEKSVLAKAIKEKMSAKKLKKYKRRAYLESFVRE